MRRTIVLIVIIPALVSAFEIALAAGDQEREQLMIRSIHQSKPVPVPATPLNIEVGALLAPAPLTGQSTGCRPNRSTEFVRSLQAANPDLVTCLRHVRARRERAQTRVMHPP